MRRSLADEDVFVDEKMSKIMGSEKEGEFVLKKGRKEVTLDPLRLDFSSVGLILSEI